MALLRERKRELVADLADIASRAQVLVVADPTGMSAVQMDALRATARAKRVVLRMTMNTLARRALSNTDYACVTDALSGPSLFAFSMDPDQPGGAASVLREFAAASQLPAIKLVSMGGRMLGVDQVSRVARLPNKAGAIAQLLSVMTAPASQLAATLAALSTHCVRVLAAVAERKRSS